MKVLLKPFFIFVAAVTLTLGLAACEPEEVPEVDEVAPTFSNVSDIAYTMEDPAPDYVGSITANDDVDGNLTSAIEVDSSQVDLTVAGTYTVTLTVADAAGNETTETYEVVVSEKVLTEEDFLDMDFEMIDFSNGVDMPKFGDNGTLFYWTSSHPLVITTSGFIVNPPVGSGPVDVTLSVRAVNGEYSKTGEFSVTVQPNEEVEVTSSVLLPFESVSEEWTLTSVPEVEVFYVDNGNVPYIDIETFLDLLDGLIESDLIEYATIGEDQLELSYEVEWEDFDGTMITENMELIVDFTQNTMTFNDLGFMTYYGVETETDYGEGLEYVDYEYTDGDAVSFDLGAYNFDLLMYDDGVDVNYLIPFHIANHLFASQNYYNVYYNGDKLWGIDTLTILDEEEYPEIIEDIRTSSLNAEDIPEDVKMASFYYYTFVLDHFFGIKYEKNVATYYPGMTLKVKDWLPASDSSYYNKIHDLTYSLNDPHTYWGIVGYYADDPTWNIGTSYSDLGARNKALSDAYWEVFDANEAKFGVGQIPDYHLIDNDTTAVVYVNSFTFDTPTEFKDILRSLPSSVENVVVDVSMNGGGNSGAVSRLLGYMTEETIMKHYLDYLDGSTDTYYIESDYRAYNYNFFVLSSNYSYSAANIFVLNAKESGIPVMGQKSGGGASGVYSVQAPDGSVFFIASTGMSSMRVGNEIDGYEYISIEFGVEPDYEMNDVTDDDEIIAIIAQYFEDTAE